MPIEVKLTKKDLRRTVKLLKAAWKPKPGQTIKGASWDGEKWVWWEYKS